MVTIKNVTDKAINIYNDVFFINIAPNKTAEIDDDILSENSEFYFVYPGPKESLQKVDSGFDVTEGARKRLAFKYEIQNIFSVATVLDLKGLTDVQVKMEDVKLRQLLIFKTVQFKRLIVECASSKTIKPRYAFMNQDDKERFLRLMRFGNVLTFPIACIALLYMIWELWNDQDGFITKATVTVLALGIAIVALEDLYYAIVARKWEALDESNEWKK